MHIEEETKDENNKKEIIEYSPDMISVHSKFSEEVIPKIGMEFMSEDSAYDFYKRYARIVGFGTRLSKSHKDNEGIILDRIFCCSCQGTREKDKRFAYVKQHSAETRFGCLALMKVSRRVNERLCVIKFEPCHNHVMASPSKTHLFCAHRQISIAQASEIDMACNSGITPKESMELMSRRAGGRQHLGFLDMDCDNYLKTKRSKDMQVGDTGGVLEYLQRKQTEDPKFFYAIQVDDDDLITNIFWADAQMIYDYSYFGDVVSFVPLTRKTKKGVPLLCLLEFITIDKQLFLVLHCYTMRQQKLSSDCSTHL
ncbi:PREDICTED: protein FAR1-RELATED SEQUENCE 5-like [Lupinus angustifolius]|uniref:protein FAR1-RELATED SEQUENCE 5-like n=1 Tax=Lupinus angustifolius TaxID=3871 RepID=UPI00092F32B4|nr:PREDICTED: protein FAR1-RELATED SEQUENCE 5-like [Lupinus angustifolius]